MIKIFNKDNQFYPTPPELAEKLISDIEWRSRDNHKVLEPSIGKGDIADAIKTKSNYIKIDGCEIEPNLQAIVKSKGYKIIHDNFLTLNTYENYDVIVMNPPFINGDVHLLKAIGMQERRGGKVRCILNAETVKNPYSNNRKLLLRKIEQYSGEVEYVQNAFSDSERKTDVEIAIVRIDIPEQKKSSNILENLRSEQKREVKEQQERGELISANYIEGVIQQYNLETKAGVKLIEEFEAFNRVNLRSFDDSDNNSILEMKIYGDQRNSNYTTIELIDGFIQETRSKYWKTLLRSDEFSKLFTSNARYEYFDKIEDLKNYDFTHYNIKQIQEDLSKDMCNMIEETIIELFDNFTKYYHDEYSSNVHLFDGWKTNSCHKINESKCIIPLNGYNSYDGRLDMMCAFKDRIIDVYKVLVYLDGGDTTKIDDIRGILKQAQDNGTTKEIDCHYFKLNVFKKGTTHFKWENQELMQKFNIYGCQKKGWLPPSYGKQNYEDMNTEEKKVIDSFEGKESYNKMMNKKDYFLQGVGNNLLMLGGGEY